MLLSLGRSGGSSHGERPIFSIKGVSPVKLLIVFIMWNLTLGSACAHPCWFHLTWNCRHCITVLLEHLDAPSVWGWYAVNSLCLILVSFISARQNFDMNNLSRSLIISLGHPFSQYHRSKKTHANSSAVILVLQGTI